MTFVNSDDSAISAITPAYSENADFDITEAHVNLLTLGSSYKLVWTPSYPSGDYTVDGAA